MRKCHWTDLMWVVEATDINGHVWKREMGLCQKCNKVSNRVFVCYETGDRYCTDCVKKDNLIEVIT